MSDINQLISDNQALVITFGLPVLTILIGFFGNFLIQRTKAKEIKLTGRLRMAELRADNFAELKLLLDEFYDMFGQLLNGLVPKHDTEAKQIDPEFLHRLYLLKSKIFLRIRVKEQLVDEFQTAFDEVVPHFLFQGKDTPKPEDFKVLSQKCRQLLSSEWERIEFEVKHLK